MFYNTSSRAKEEFRPLIPGRVGVYSCGPTVYNFAHIGNLSTFLFVDLLKRWLVRSGYEVCHVMNLTDVDDKTIRGSQQAEMTLSEFTKKYAQAFFDDLSALNIIDADHYPYATDYIEEMLSLIETLIENGHAYEKNGSVYFKISSFPGYGDFAGIDTSELFAEAPVIKADEYGKGDIRDFALWKAWTEDDGNVFWESPWGKGRPGWHIECSAMSMIHLGPTFDIHTGGVDLIFPHHQNEIAQSEGATGKQFVRFWLHREHLMMGENKMSKSKGAALFLRDIVNSPFDAAAFRYLVLSCHHRSQISFTDETFLAAKKTLQRILRVVDGLKAVNQIGQNDIIAFVQETKRDFESSMNDDLNTPNALAAIFRLIASLEKMLADNILSQTSANYALEFLGNFDFVFGVINLAQTDEIPLTEELLELLKQRKDARAQKNWPLADEIRERFTKKGIMVQDTTEGVKLSRM
ncbi:cysteine--tRNA ligase [Patescibacteria group bacterium]|nr:cysteine--tRNA ligase [Patescibacteria group bacterium]